jgi:hypothetical protein
MEELKKLDYDLDQLADAFDIQRVKECDSLSEWIAADYELSATETEIINDLHQETVESGDYWNEEELKIEFVGIVFLAAKIKVKDKIKVYYERALSADINGYRLAVIADCFVATPKKFSSPQSPYFFLQEFKKGKGEKNDPEAQMLTAMLIAQHKNQDNKPMYGGYLVGRSWVFTTLSGSDYCTSRIFDASQKADLLHIVSILRHLKSIILNR